MIVLYQSLFYIIVFYYFIIVSCFHLSLASWLLFSNKVQFSSAKLLLLFIRHLSGFTSYNNDLYESFYKLYTFTVQCVTVV